jgi:hypothetical protein
VVGGSSPLGLALEGVELGDGIVAEPLIMFPLVAKQPPAKLAVKADREAEGLTFAEPEFPARRYNLEIGNAGAGTVLMLGGGVVVGGRLDRLIESSILLPSKSRVEVEVLPAEYPRDRRAEAKPFRLLHSTGGGLAPPFLRERAIYDPSRLLVPVFVSHFLAFREKGDKRRSLAAIDDASALNDFCIACQRGLASVPDLAEKRVVGMVVAVRGRIQTIELFGSNALFRSYFAPLLRSQVYAAAVVELRAKELGMPVPREGDANRAVRAARERAEKTLAGLRARVRTRQIRRPSGTTGESLLVRIAGATGHAAILDGRLVHTVVFPANPFEEALFSRELKPPAESGESETGSGALERRADRGTLSEYERRLLERMRQRRPR